VVAQSQSGRNPVGICKSHIRLSPKYQTSSPELKFSHMRGLRTYENVSVIAYQIFLGIEVWEVLFILKARTGFSIHMSHVVKELSEPIFFFEF
jgi:hypothetical protein